MKSVRVYFIYIVDDIIAFKPIAVHFTVSDVNFFPHQIFEETIP